jgi:class 3 adenylate cyclase
MKWIKGCILFTDIENSTKWWRECPNLMGTFINEHERRIRRHVRDNKGWVVKSIGDSLMCFIERKEDAKKAAEAIQRDFSENPLSLNGKRIKIRIGICCGDLEKRYITIQGHELVDFLGPVVNRAARMESDYSPANGFAVCADNVEKTKGQDGRSGVRISSGRGSGMWLLGITALLVFLFGTLIYLFLFLIRKKHK